MFLGVFQKCKRRKPLILLAFPDPSQKYFKNGNPKSVFGKMKNPFLGEFPIFGKHFWENLCFWGGRKIATKYRRCALMRKKGFKGRCTKKALSKSKEICRTYDPIQSMYAEKLEESPDIKEIRCNVLLEGLEEGEYTSDFVCVKTNGDLMVRECLQRDRLTKPMNAKLLNASRNYWARRGIQDWGLIINEE